MLDEQGICALIEVEGEGPRPLTALRAVREAVPAVMMERAAAARGPREARPRWGYAATRAALQPFLARVMGVDPETQRRIGRVAVVASTLAGWSRTRGVYRFDERLFARLWYGVVSRDIPTERLYDLPEGCVYVEVPAGVARHPLVSQYDGLKGFYLWVEHGPPDFPDALMILLDFDDFVGGGRLQRLLPVAMELGTPTIAGCVRAQFVAGKAGAELAGHAGVAREAGELLESEDFDDAALDTLSPFVSVALRLCSPATSVRTAAEEGGVRFWTVR